MKLFLLISLFGFSSINFQERYITRTGHISFFSEAPLENIEAHNYQVNSVFDKTTGKIAFSVLIRGFEFEKALMQEHFNENFMESHKFPKATFSGQVVDYQSIDFEEEKMIDIKVEGEMTIHGVTRNIEASGKMEATGEKFIASSTFPIKVADYDIKVPSVVRNNIAEVVEVTVEVTLEPYVN